MYVVFKYPGRQMRASETTLFVTFALSRPLVKATAGQKTTVSVSDVLVPSDVGPRCVFFFSWLSSFGMWLLRMRITSLSVLLALLQQLLTWKPG